MSGIEPTPPEDTRGAPLRPSLLFTPDGDNVQGQKPIRLLSALQQNEPRRRAAGWAGRRRGLIAFITLSIACATALFVATNSDSSGAPDVAMVDTSPATVPVAPPAAVPAASAATGPAPAPSSGDPTVRPADAPPDGPAQVETAREGLAALPGMASAAEAVAAQRAEASAPLLASPPAQRHSKSRPSPTSKAPAAANARAKPDAGTASPVRDADAELVAAIMARMEPPRPSSGRGAGAAATGRPDTIASMVRDCNAITDSDSALACRRRICEGYWGKAQACPRSMAPSTSDH